jgi:DNA repair exonuclease SbcCD ATPase subunit
MLEMLLEPPPANPVAFKQFLEEQTNFFVESMQDAADNQWHDFRESCEDDEQGGAMMERWWDEQTSRFRKSLVREHRREVMRTIRRLGRVRQRARSLKEQVESLEGRVESLEIKTEELRVDGQVARDALRQVMDEALCRNCYGLRYREW